GRDRKAGPGTSPNWKRDTADRHCAHRHGHTRPEARAHSPPEQKRAGRWKPETGPSAKARGWLAAAFRIRRRWRWEETGWRRQAAADAPAKPGGSADSESGDGRRHSRPASSLGTPPLPRTIPRRYRPGRAIPFWKRAVRSRTAARRRGKRPRKTRPW